MWTDVLEPFENAARRLFQFLTEDKGFSGAVVERGRDFFLVYDDPNGGRRISIGLEKNCLVPFIFIETSTPTGRVHAHLPSTLKKLNIDVDAGQFPYCNELLSYCEPQAIVPDLSSSRSQDIHKEYWQELSGEYVHFLEVYASALRRHFDRIMEFSKTEEADDSIKLGGSGCLSSVLIVLAFTLFLNFRDGF